MSVYERLSEHLSMGDMKLKWQFFVIFSRFEYALKWANYRETYGDGSIGPNWISLDKGGKVDLPLPEILVRTLILLQRKIQFYKRL